MSWFEDFNRAHDRLLKDVSVRSGEFWGTVCAALTAVFFPIVIALLIWSMFT